LTDLNFVILHVVALIGHLLHRADV